MADDTATNGAPTNSSWTIDVQRGLAWTIILIFSAILILLIARVVYSATSSEILTLLQQGFGVLTNVVLLIVGYFFGSSKSSQSKDDTQNKIVEKLTSTAPPGPTGPVAPIATPTTVVVAWWSVLTPVEQAAIEAFTPNPRVLTFIKTAKVGKATPDDLDYLVTLGLLTQDRATAIQSA